MAIPSSTAIVLNSRGTAPAAFTESETTWPTSRRCTWPGTNSVKLLATATIGLPMSSPATPLARMRARAPTMFLPWVTVRDRSGGMTCSPQGCGAFSVPAACPPCGARPPAGQAMIVVDFALAGGAEPPTIMAGMGDGARRRPRGARRAGGGCGQRRGRAVSAASWMRSISSRVSRCSRRARAWARRYLRSRRPLNTSTPPIRATVHGTVGP